MAARGELDAGADPAEVRELALQLIRVRKELYKVWELLDNAVATASTPGERDLLAAAAGRGHSAGRGPRRGSRGRPRSDDSCGSVLARLRELAAREPDAAELQPPGAPPSVVAATSSPPHRTASSQVRTGNAPAAGGPTPAVFTRRRARRHTALPAWPTAGGLPGLPQLDPRRPTRLHQAASKPRLGCARRGACSDARCRPPARRVAAAISDGEGESARIGPG